MIGGGVCTPTKKNTKYTSVCVFVRECVKGADAVGVQAAAEQCKSFVKILDKESIS